MKILIEHGADLSIEDKNGLTPRDIAVQKGIPKCYNISV